MFNYQLSKIVYKNLYYDYVEAVNGFLKFNNTSEINTFENISTINFKQRHEEFFFLISTPFK